MTGRTPDQGVAPWARAWALVLHGLKLAWRSVRGGTVGFYNSSNLTFASSIAYYTLLSIFPFLLLVLTLLSRLAVTRSDTLLRLVERALPSNFEFLVAQVRELGTTPLRLSLAGMIVTLWASMGVFGAITSAVNHAWGVEQNYSFLKHKLVAFLMLMASGLLLVVTLLVVSAAQIVEASWFADVLVRYPQLDALTGFLVTQAPLPMFVVIVGLVYYFIPNAKVRLRDVWFGAILAGVLWRLAFAGFAWYVRDLSSFTIHGSVAAAVVAFLVWVFMSAVILLFGVEVTVAYARERREINNRNGRPTG